MVASRAHPMEVSAMTGSRQLRCLSAISAAVLLAACGSGGGGATGGSESEPTTRSSGSGSGVTVTSDIPYMETADGFQPAVLDVYAPEDASGAPLVVLLHGGAETKTTLMLPDLADAVASTGAVVVVPNWGATGPPAPGAGAVDEVAATVQRAGCAVAYAVAHAGEWGANGEAVTLFGHSLGANVASVLALEPEQDLAGCAPEAAKWTTNGAVLVDGDLALMDGSLWDAYGDDLAGMYQAMAPWRFVTDGFTGPVHLFAASAFRALAERCGDVTTWAQQRDPSGALAGDLSSADTNGDGCIDHGEVEVVLAERMGSAGTATDYAELDGQGTSHTQWSSDDLQEVVAAITSITSSTA